MSPTVVCLHGHDWDLSATPPGTPPRCPTCGSPPRPLATGPTVPGYELLRELGHGRMGVVFLARQLLHDRLVALKLLDDEALAGLRDLTSFEHEGRTAARLQHPSVVTLYEVGDAAGQPYLATEFVSAPTLQQRLGKGPLADREAAVLLETLARAVQHAHEQHLLHLDLEPANVFLTSDCTPRITDFGLAVFLRAQPGNPGYAAPEQSGGTAVGPAADVHALGAILYETLTGRPPYLAPTNAQTLQLTRTREPVTLRQLQPGVSPDLEFIYLKCLQKRPDRRYPTALALAEDLWRFLDGKAVQSWPQAFRGHVGRWCRHNPLAAGLSAAACLLLAVALPLVIGAYHQAGEARMAAQEERRLAEQARLDLQLRRDEEAAARQKAEHQAWQADLQQKDWHRHHDELKQELHKVVKDRKDALEKRDTEALLRRTAEENAQAAVLASKEAAAARRESAQQLIKLEVASGTRLLQSNDPAGSLLWFTEALRLTQLERLPEETHRLRLAAILSQCPRPTQVWTADKTIHVAQLSPDGRQVLRAGVDGTAVVWNAATGQRIGDEMQHATAISQASFSPDGRRILTVCGDQTVHVWDMATSKEAIPALQLLGPVVSASFSPDGRRFLTVGYKSAETFTDLELRVFETGTGEALSEEPIGSQIAAQPAAFSPDSRRVLSICQDRCARIWDAVSGEQVGASLQHRGDLFHASYSLDGQFVLTASREGTARVWEASTGKPITPPVKHGAALCTACLSSSGRHLLTAGADRLVRLWDTSTGEPAGTSIRQPEDIAQATFSPDGRYVLTTAADWVRICDVESGEEVSPPLRHNGPVVQAMFNPTGATLLTLSGKVVRVWDLTTGELPKVRPEPLPDDKVSAFTSDGRLVLRATGRTARVYDTGTNKPIGPPLEHLQEVSGVSFSPDGRRLLTITHQLNGDVPEGRVRIWEGATGKATGDALLHPQAVKAALFSPEGDRVLTVCQDRKARLWDVAKSAVIGAPMEHKEEVSRALFTPSGAHVLTIDAEGGMRLWDSATAEAIGAIWGHQKPVHDVAFSSDGKRLVTASEDGLARVWETATGHLEVETAQRGSSVIHAVFSPNGDRLATVSTDRSVRIWDAATGKPTARPLAHRTPITLAQFSANGRWLITAANDGVRLWEAATGELVSPLLRQDEGSRPVTFMSLGKDGRLVTACGRPGDPHDRCSRQLKPDDRPAADLLVLARVLTGQRFAGIGELAACDAAEMARDWQGLRAKYASEFAPAGERVAAWVQRGAAECERRQLWVGVVKHLDHLLAERSAPPELYAQRARAHKELRHWEAAWADYSRGLETGSSRWDLWAGRGAAAAGLARWEQASADYSRAIELKGDEADLYAERARAEAERDDWSRAAADLARAIHLGRKDIETHQQHALALLAGGDETNFRRWCGRLVQHFAGSEDEAVARKVAWTCVLKQDALMDPQPLLRRAERAVAGSSPSPADLHRLAYLLYRTGQYDAAHQRLRDVERLAGQDLAVLDLLFLAMTKQRLGRAEDAKTTLARAEELARPKGADSGTNRPPWPERVAQQVLLREAAALIKGAKP
jgi:WD40 repeat protein/Flp pilus assembly protein TadD